MVSIHLEKAYNTIALKVFSGSTKQQCRTTRNCMIVGHHLMLPDGHGARILPRFRPSCGEYNPIATCVELYDKNITIVEYKGRSSHESTCQARGGRSRWDV